jgi:hypothetical protein
LGVRGLGEKLAADMGNCYHAALEEHFRGKGKAKVMQIFEIEYDKLVPIGEFPSEPRFAKPNVMMIMERYVDVHPLEKFPFVALEWEETKGLKLSEEVMFWVKRDMLVEDRISGLREPLDHKTTGKVTDWWIKKFRHSSQFSGYIYVTGELEKMPCESIYVNALEIGKLPDSTRKCKTHGVKYSECSKEHAKFDLLRYSRTRKQLDKWKEDALAIAKKAEILFKIFADIDLLQYARRNGSFNNGCTFCEFKGWCLMGFKKEGMEEFVVGERWEPWKGKAIEAV